MVNNKRKNIQRPLMEDLYIGNLTNDTTEEEILALLALNGTTYLRENSLERMQFTDNGKFAGCIHTCSYAPTVYRSNFGAQWTGLQEQKPCYSAAYRNDEVTAEW